MENRESEIFEPNHKEIDSWVTNFIDGFKQLLGLLNERKESKSTFAKDLINSGESEEEKSLIRTMCEEIDAFYKARTEMIKAKQENPTLTTGEWFENELISLGNEITQTAEQRNLTPEEAKSFIKSIKDKMDISIEANANNLMDNKDGFEDDQV